MKSTTATLDEEELLAKTILVVDDESSIRRIVQIILSEFGFKNVFLAGSSQEALEMMGIAETTENGHQPPAAAIKPDLVLLDIMLPKRNGFDVCKIIKSRFDRNIPVILMTGFNIEQHHALYVESGAEDFLHKPVNPRDLGARVRVHLLQAAAAAKERETDVPGAPTGGVELMEMSHVGPYALEKTLSWNGSVSIYRARRGDETVAFKILTSQALEYEDVLQRFKREIEMMSSFDHPNVIRLLDTGEHLGMPYYVMEYVSGPNLEMYAANHTHPPCDTICHVARSVADALQHVHDKGVIHRDVKLKNVFMSDDDGQAVKLGDFGIALGVGDVRMTETGYAIGTPVYMAPEQFEGHKVSVRSDIYSFAASMYHLITGSPPFVAGNAMELVRKHIEEKAPAMSELRSAIPPIWDERITRCWLAKKPEDRPADMQAVLEDLRVLEQHPF